MHRTDECLVKSAWRELEDVIFTKADSRWVHHPQSNALVIAARVANSNVNRMLVDNGSTIDIIYLDAYKRLGLTESELSPMTSPLYEFTGDHVIPKGMIKLAVTVGEHPQVLIVITEFHVMDCPSVFNGVIGRSLLKALKIVTSIIILR